MATQGIWVTVEGSVGSVGSGGGGNAASPGPLMTPPQALPIVGGAAAQISGSDAERIKGALLKAAALSQQWPAVLAESLVEAFALLDRKVAKPAPEVTLTGSVKVNESPAAPTPEQIVVALEHIKELSGSGPYSDSRQNQMAFALDCALSPERVGAEQSAEARRALRDSIRLRQEAAATSDSDKASALRVESSRAFLRAVRIGDPQGTSTEHPSAANGA